MIQFKAVAKKFGKQGEKTGWTYIEIPFDIAEKKITLALATKPAGENTHAAAREQKHQHTKKIIMKSLIENSRSKLYLDVVKFLRKRKVKSFRANDLRNFYCDKYSYGTYSAFLAKHCCDEKSKNGKNSRGYIIYFCRKNVGEYVLA